MNLVFRQGALICSDQIEEPKLIHFAQINFGGVFEDKAADILLMDQ